MRTPALPLALLTVAMSALALLSIWTACCYFPFDSWNSIRLAPAAMVYAGQSPYPSAAEGPLTTWTYGPVGLLWMLLAMGAAEPARIVMSGAFLNALLTVIPIAFACFSANFAAGLSPASRLAAAGLAVLLWPTHSLLFFQADNAAIACGIGSNLLLAGATSLRPGRAWAAALLAALALWSKQNEVGLVIGQLAWLAGRDGLRASLAHGLRTVAAAAACGLMFATWFGAEGLVFNLFTLPATFGVGAPGKLWAPEFLPYFALQVVVPLILIVANARRVFARDSAWRLPALVAAASLPFTVIGFLSPGGTVNALHAHLFLLPAAAVAVVRLSAPRRALWPAWVLAALAFSLPTLLELPRPTRPLTRGLREGMALARQLPGEAYFPWNPLITWRTDGRFYHAEDGLRVRRDSPLPLPAETVRAHLPPRMSVIAYHAAVTEDIVAGFAPPGAQRSRYGEWILISWVPEAP